MNKFILWTFKKDLLKGIHIKKDIFFNSVSWQKIDLSIVFTKLSRYLKYQKDYLSVITKNNQMIFFLACNSMFTDY